MTVLPDAAVIGAGMLPGRVLDRRELTDLVASLAADPRHWRNDVAFPADDGADEHRHYVCLHRDEHVDVWLLCWTGQSDTGWHDHDISSGAVAVAQGRLVEHSLTIGVESLTRTVEAGTVFSFGPEHIHRLTGVEMGSVSIHAYSPPLQRLGQYDVDSRGVLRRTSISSDEELRPSAGAAG